MRLTFRVPHWSRGLLLCSEGILAENFMRTCKMSLSLIDERGQGHLYSEGWRDAHDIVQAYYKASSGLAC